jgi:hypothetical protein
LVSVVFLGVACETEGLKVGEFIGTSFAFGLNMIHFKILIFSGNSTKLATELSSFQNFISDRAGNRSAAAASMIPV